MNKYIDYFVKTMGPAVQRIDAPHPAIEKYRGHLPDLLLKFWDQYGRSGYGDGIFWTVNPAEYDDLVHHWLGESGIANPETFHVIARSAFGDLYLWQSHTLSTVKISTFNARYQLTIITNLSPEKADIHVSAFFMSKERTTGDYNDLFSDALKKLGPLKPDEMYGFVPVIALGGPNDLEHLEKVKMIEHLTFLSQLTPLTDWCFPDLKDL
jgi:hypothetical protein